MTDTGYWVVMAFMAVLVVVATGGVTTYAYFSQDRWSEPRELVSEAKDKVSAAVHGGGVDDDAHDVRARDDRDHAREKTAA